MVMMIMMPSTVWEKPAHSLFHSIHLRMSGKIEQKLLHSVINEELGLQKVDVILAKIKHQKKNVKSRCSQPNFR